MFIQLLKAKIHGVRVTEADINYTGSIAIDKDLMDAAGLVNDEIVMVADVTNGNRLTTYAIPAEPGSRQITMNGAAARLINKGDTILIFAFAYMTNEEAKDHKATVLIMDPETNTIRETLHY